MSKCEELRKLLLKWGKNEYLPLLDKIQYLENENYRLRKQNTRINDRNKRLMMIIERRNAK